MGAGMVEVDVVVVVLSIVEVSVRETTFVVVT